ncbi:MAG: TIGR02757 family protein, partial [Flavobacteriales bacterium]|nr:TIGR02757 family protein [Flavobacteriales bacterium]
GRAVHRTFSQRDFVFFLRGLKNIYAHHNSLEDLFAPQIGENGTWEGISRFRKEMLILPHTQDNERHISSPEKGSACKRLHLFLRWMVRRDGIVDLGLWKNISPASLSIPLDVHVGNMTRMLGILHRNQNDRKAVEEIDAFLRKCDPSDPAKYDFALFGLGESGYFNNVAEE